MDKEEIEKAKENIKKQNSEEVKDDLRTLYKILWNEHREGTYTIEKALKYIAELELEVKSYKMTHKHDVNIIDEVKGEALKLYKERDSLKAILDKVTDKLKEDKNKKIPLAEDMDWVICRKQYAREILNIIEGEKK